jgi:hypothetical protein
MYLFKLFYILFYFIFLDFVAKNSFIILNIINNKLFFYFWSDQKK